MNAIKNLSKITALIAELSSTHSALDWEMNYTLETCIKSLELLQKCNPDKPNEKLVVLSQEQLDTELGEAYREGKKTALEELPVENHITPPETEEDEEEEDDDSVEPCKCKADWDIRCLCDPVRSAKQFSRCPQRFNMTYECIKNDFEKYKDIEASFTRGDKQQKIVQYAREEPFFLNDDNLEDELLYLIEQDEENEEENCCVNCDGFIPYADESSAKWCDSEERWVCYSCSNDCFCAECEEYFPNEDDLEYLNRDSADCDKFCCDCLIPKKCEHLKDEVSNYIDEMEDDQDKLNMLEEIKNVIDKYYKPK